MFFSNLILILLVIIMIFFEVVRKRTLVFDTLFFFNAWFFFAFILSPFLIINFGSEFSHPSFHVENKFGYLISILSIAIFYFAVLLGTRVNTGLSRKIIVVSKKYTQENYYRLIAILFIIGILSTFFFILQYGGISFFIENVNTIRNGKIERNTGAAFVGLFSGYLSYSYYLLLIIFLLNKKGSRSKQKGLFIIIIILFLLSIGVASIRGSREGLLNIFMISYLINVFITRKYYVRYILLLIPFFIFFILYGKDFFTALSLDLSETLSTLKEIYKKNDTLQSFKNLMHNFAHPFMSLNQAINITGSTIDLRYFMDIPYSFIFYLQLFGYESPDTITYINTYYAIGRFESNIPPGIVALLWYNLKVYGVFLGGIVFGYILTLTETIFFKSIRDDNPLSILIYIFMVITIGHFIFVGDLRVSIIQNLSMSIVILFYIITHLRLRLIR